MLLRDLIARPDELIWHNWIYVESGVLSLDTPVALATTPDQDMGPGMTALLVVADLQGIMQAWSNFRDGRKPTPEQALRAIRYYEENDAFIPESVDP